MSSGSLISWSRGRLHRLHWITATWQKMAPSWCSKCCFLNSLAQMGISQISPRSKRRRNVMIQARTATAVVISTYYSWPPHEQAPRLLGNFSTSNGRTCSTCLSLCGTSSACWPWLQRQTMGQFYQESTAMYYRGSSCVISLFLRSSSLPLLRTTWRRLFSAESQVYHSVKILSALLWSKMSLKGIVNSPDTLWSSSDCLLHLYKATSVELIQLQRWRGCWFF